LKLRIPSPLLRLGRRILNKITLGLVDKKAAVVDYLNVKYPGYKIRWQASSDIKDCSCCHPDSAKALYSTGSNKIKFSSAINEKSEKIYMNTGCKFNLYYGACDKCRVVYWHVIIWSS
jgi:hypothetical protein